MPFIRRARFARKTINVNDAVVTTGKMIKKENAAHKTEK